MRERPIIFNSEMVRAVMEGRKVQTRRIIQERHLYRGRGPGNWPAHMPTGQEGEQAIQWLTKNSPFGAVGDRLWVRETFSIVPRTAYAVSEGVQQVIRPDDNHDAAIFRSGWEHSSGGIRWRPSIHMPRWASRITLEITGVRVERLQDISDADAQAEGCWFGRGGGEPDLAVSPADHFPTLWVSIYGEESWQANPWVWVIEFKRLEGE